MNKQKSGDNIAAKQQMLLMFSWIFEILLSDVFTITSFLYFLIGDGDKRLSKFQVPTTLSAGYVLLLIDFT